MLSKMTSLLKKKSEFNSFEKWPFLQRAYKLIVNF